MPVVDKAYPVFVGRGSVQFDGEFSERESEVGEPGGKFAAGVRGLIVGRLTVRLCILRLHKDHYQIAGVGCRVVKFIKDSI